MAKGPSRWRDHPRQLAQAHDQDYLGAIDLVTDTNRQCERTIVEILTGGFPDHSILADEETLLEHHENSYRWIVDPLDGTTNFAHDYPHFCVSIALEHSGEVISALVYDRMRRECFRAIKGSGATLNDQSIRCSAVEDLDKALPINGLPYDRRDFADNYLSYFKASLIRCEGIRRNGSRQPWTCATSPAVASTATRSID